MANNLVVTPGVGATVAAEEISSVKYSQAKLVDATVGSTAPTGVAANPLQVSIANTGANTNKLLVTPDLSVGAATSANQITTNSVMSSIDGKIPATGQTTISGSLPVVLPASQITTLTPPAAITGFSTSTKQSDGSQKTQVVDGSGNVIGATSNALDINIKSGNPTTMTATQATGTNLHTVVDSGAVTVTNATASNLKAEVTNAGTFATQATLAAETTKVIGTINVASSQTIAVTQATGTNLHTVVDSMPTTTISGMAISPNYTTSVFDGTNALLPKFATISVSGSGNNTLVAAVASKKLRVLAYNFISAGTVNAKFQSAAGGTDLTGLKYCVANMGICAPFNPVGWFETGAGALLNLSLSAAIAVGGELVYIEV